MQREKKKILHAVGRMSVGGVETWILHLLENIDSESFQIDIMVNSFEPGEYDEAALCLGAKIHCVGSPKDGVYQYCKNVLRVLKSGGGYDAVHSHLWLFSSLILFLAWMSNLGIRISHSRNTNGASQVQNSVISFVYRSFSRCAINLFSTHRLAITSKAGSSLYGKNWGSKTNDLIVPSGIDFKLFDEFLEEGLRKEKERFLKNMHGVGSEDLVLGHVGSFIPQKNHFFIIDIVKVLSSYNFKVKLFFIGDGFLIEEVKNYAEKQGVSGSVFFPGKKSQEDVVIDMKYLFNFFVFPSNFEGQGRVVVEAQAAGLKCFISEDIPEEVDVLEGEVIRLPLNKGAGVWADKISYEATVAKYSGDLESTEKNLEKVFNSRFDIKNNIKSLSEIYSGGLI